MRIPRLKFAEFEDRKYFTTIINKPEANILKESKFCALKIWKYNTMGFFFFFFNITVRIFLSLYGKTSQKETNTALAVCAMLVTILQEAMFVIRL